MKNWQATEVADLVHQSIDNTPPPEAVYGA